MKKLITVIFLISNTKGVAQVKNSVSDSLLQSQVIEIYKNANKSFILDLQNENIPLQGWSDCPCFEDSVITGYNIIEQYSVFQELYKIEQLLFPESDKCMLIFKKSCNCFLFEYKSITRSAEDLKLLKEVFSQYDLWIKILKKQGIKKIIKNKIHPLSHSPFSWRNYFDKRDWNLQ